MKKPRFSGLCIALFALSALALLSGCAGDITGAGVRADPGTGMSTMGYNTEQHRNEMSRTLHYGFREFWDDWDSFWLIDEPNRSTKWPIP